MPRSLGGHLSPEMVWLPFRLPHGGFARLYYADPCKFAEWEGNEEALRADLGDVSILKDRTGGTTTPLTLRQLRERIERAGKIDMFDVGGCGCFVDVEDDQQEGT